MAVNDTANDTTVSVPNEEAQFIQKIYARYRRAEQATANKHSQFKILDMFDRGEQWKDAAIPAWVPKPVANWVKYIRTLKRANLASAIPVATYAARSPEYKDQMEMLHRAYRHVWETEKISRVVRRCIDRAVIQGTSIVMVYTDDSYVGGQYYGSGNAKNALYQGRICVKRIPNGHFFPDPDAYNITDCKYVDMTDNLPLKQVQNNKKFKAYAGEKLANLKNANIAISSTESGEIFDRDNSIANNIGNQIGDEMVTVHTHWERYLNDQGRWQVDTTQYIAGTTWILNQTKDIKPSMLPFAVLYDEEEENEFWGSSTAYDILELQKLVNKTAQVAAVMGALHQNNQKVVTRSSGISAKELARTGQMPGKVWTTNDVEPAKSIHHLQPPDIPQGLFNLEDRAKNDMREMVGINEAYTGQSVGSLTTSTGVNSLIERATIRDKDKMVQIDEFVERISDLIILNIMHKWDSKRPTTTIGPDGKPIYSTYEPLDKTTIDNLEWICRSNVYAKAPTTQALRKQWADDMMQRQGQFNYDPPIITPEEWIQAQDTELGEEILQRMQRDRERMAQEQATETAQVYMHMADQIIALRKQGLPEEQVQQQAMQMANEIIQQRQQEEAKNGRPRDAANAPQGPGGDTGQMAMNAMAKGS